MRTGPEVRTACRLSSGKLITSSQLEIPAYGALDHYLGKFGVSMEIMSDWKLIVDREGDTFAHSWELLAIYHQR